MDIHPVMYLQLCLNLPWWWSMFQPSATLSPTNLDQSQSLPHLPTFPPSCAFSSSLSLWHWSVLYIWRRNLKLNRSVMKHVPICDAGSSPLSGSVEFNPAGGQGSDVGGSAESWIPKVKLWSSWMNGNAVFHVLVLSPISSICGGLYHLTMTKINHRSFNRVSVL